MFQVKTKILFNIQIAENYFKMCLDAPAVAQKAQPGQFIYVRISNKYEPLLRRAFSIHRISHQSPATPEGQAYGAGSHQLKNKKKPNLIEILYKIKGIGTKILSEKKAGEELDIIGPLGNGFQHQPPVTPEGKSPTSYGAGSHQSPVLVVGGIGVAPLVFLAQKLTENRKPKTDNRVLVLLGAKTKKEILCKKDFGDLGCELKIATDDGSQGFKGKVTELLKNLPATRFPQPASRIFACGPNPMLKEISEISQKYKIPAQISLEEKMACGIGACRGCAVKIAPRNPQPATRFPQEFIYKRVCKDGPVFDAQEVIWG